MELIESADGVLSTERLPLTTQPRTDPPDHTYFRTGPINAAVRQHVLVARLGDLRVAVEGGEPGHDVVAARVPAAGHFRPTVVDEATCLMRTRIEPSGVVVALS